MLPGLKPERFCRSKTAAPTAGPAKIESFARVFGMQQVQERTRRVPVGGFCSGRSIAAVMVNHLDK